MLYKDGDFIESLLMIRRYYRHFVKIDCCGLRIFESGKAQRCELDFCRLPFVGVIDYQDIGIAFLSGFVGYVGPEVFFVETGGYVGFKIPERVREGQLLAQTRIGIVRIFEYMGAQAVATLSREEYLILEEHSNVKHEYYAGTILAMAGASYEHVTIVNNLTGHLFAALKGGCRTLGSDMRVRIDEEDSYIYPDLTVLCGAANLTMERPPALLNPNIIFEVLSSSTEADDRFLKLPVLMQIPDLQEIVLVGSQRRSIEHYVRRGSDWVVLPVLLQAEHVLKLATVDVRLPLSEIYEGVDFSAPAVQA